MKSMKSGGNHYLLTCYLWLYRSDIVFLAIQHKGGGLTELLVMALCGIDYYLPDHHFQYFVKHRT